MNDVDNIMIVFRDNDFCRVFDWIGRVALDTLLNTNFCNETIITDRIIFEDFVKSLLPIGIKFAQHKYEDCEYLSSEFTKCIYFKYNFNLDDEDYIFGGCELLIIDLIKKEYYIR